MGRVLARPYPGQLGLFVRYTFWPQQPQPQNGLPPLVYVVAIG